MKSQELIRFYSVLLTDHSLHMERPPIMRPQGLPCTGGCTLRASYGCEILQTSVEMHKRCCRRLFLQCFGQKTSRKGEFFD